MNKMIGCVIVFTLFIVAEPVSWYLAWKAGSWLTVIISLIIPTYGTVYYILLHWLEHSFIHSFLSLILGVIGSILFMMSALLCTGKK